MIEVTVKTLDSKNHSFSVPCDLTVRQFKERIASSVGVTAESQRLISSGKVLQDDKCLQEYDVSGKVIHLVQRAPPQLAARNEGTDSQQRDSQDDHSHHHHYHFHQGGSRRRRSVVVGAVGPSSSSVRLGICQEMLSQAMRIMNRLDNPESPNPSNADPVVTSPPLDQNDPESSSSSNPHPGEYQGFFEGMSDDTGHGPLMSAMQVDINVEVQSDLNLRQGERRSRNRDSNVEQVTPRARSQSTNSRNSGEGGRSSSVPPPQERGGSHSRDHRSEEGNRQQQGGPGIQHPRTQVLADVIEELVQANNRLRPHMERVRDLMRNDPRLEVSLERAEAQRSFNLTMQALHYLSHAHHAVSDMMVDFSRPPPREIRAVPFLTHFHPLTIQAGIPIQAEISLQTGPPQTHQSFSDAAGRNQSESSPQSEQSNTNNLQSGGNNPQSGGNNPQSGGNNPQSGGNNPQSGGNNPQLGGFRPGIPYTFALPPVMVMEMGPATFTIETGRAPVPGNSNATPSSGTSPSEPPPLTRNSVPTAENGTNTGASQEDRNGIGTRVESFLQGESNQGGGGNRSGSQSGGGSSGGGGGPWSRVQDNFPIPAGFIQHVMNTVTSAIQSGLSASAGHASSINREGTGGSGGETNQGQGSQQTGQHVRGEGHSPGVRVMYGNGGPVPRPFLPPLSFSAAHDAAAPRTQTPRVPHQQSMETVKFSHFKNILVFLISLYFPCAFLLYVQSAWFPFQSQSTANTNASGSMPVSDMLQSLSQLLQVFGSSGNSLTLSQILRNFLDQQEVPADQQGFPSDAILVMSDYLTLPDIISLYFGNSEPLQRVQAPLRQYAATRILRNQEPTLVNISNAVEDLIREVTPGLQYFVDMAPVHDTIDATATMQNFLRIHLRELLQLLFRPLSAAEFAPLFRQCFQECIHTYLGLAICCLQYGQLSLEELFTDSMRDVLSSMGNNTNVFGQMMASIPLTHLRGLLSSVPALSTQQRNRYIVYRPSGPSSRTSEPMETDPDTPAESAATTVAPSVATSASCTPNSNATGRPVEQIEETATVGNEWENTMDPEWVAVIKNDTAVQHRMSPGKPFSDAYLSGMPAKRRRLVTGSKPQGTINTILTDTLRRAVNCAGVQPQNQSTLEVTQAAGESASLQAAYNEQVRLELQKLMKDNKDYQSSKYPNTEKYIRKVAGITVFLLNGVQVMQSTYVCEWHDSVSVITKDNIIF
ncbi:unnamed protein product [Darwinula stevensoni]|uniref:BCL2-associated athanogene 6 n=1 Tax=Darwinula stevensoni TaxID=69355 RepID=A0A7R9A2C1_9CRUS|nr:unnamed protein product [Darwinula stevensoni]CAG0889376.1 unnamed protein product [Darwinula stevensoni]